MRKIRKISELHPTIGFTEFDIYRNYHQSFEQSELGAIFRIYPFRSLAQSLKLKEYDLGRRSYFSPEGKIALMVLKNYSGLSDKEFDEIEKRYLSFSKWGNLLNKPPVEEIK
jgi:hypothetical protein